MTAASIVNKRRPILDTAYATVQFYSAVEPDGQTTATAAALAATLIRRKARSDADALILLNALGIDEVGA